MREIANHQRAAADGRAAGIGVGAARVSVPVPTLTSEPPTRQLSRRLR